jgi:Lambda phage tail tape-measure protein (Tape_meas_lam_C)
MADANLNLQITGDSREFQAALARAVAANKAAAEKIAKDYSTASEKAAAAVKALGQGLAGVADTVGRNVGQAATQYGDMWAGAAQGAFQSVQAASRGMISSMAGIFGPGWARLADLAMNLFALPIERMMDRAAQMAARFIRDNPGLVPNATAPPGWDQYFDPMPGSQRPAAPAAGSQLPLGVGPQMGPVDQAILGAHFGPAVANLMGQAQMQEVALNVVGQTAGTIARARAQLELWTALWRQGAYSNGNSPSPEQLAAMEAALTRISEAGDATQVAQDRQQAISTLRRQIELQGELANAIHLTAGERARERAEAMVRGFRRQGQRGASLLEDEEVQAMLARTQAAADASARLKLTNEMGQAVEFQTMQYALQTQVLGQNAGEVARLTFLMQQEQAARRAGVALTEADRVVMGAYAEEMRRNAQASAEATERFKHLQDIGRSVASNLESAFAKFMDGTKQSWKSFFNDLAKDMAKLEFRQMMTWLMGGTSANPVGLIGNLFGFGGARAEGGPVSAGTSYLVGEHGPELFRSRSAGHIVPNSALRGGSPSVINFRVDLAGANGDETIARISAQAARMAAMAAVQESNAAFPARQRRLQMLGA